MAAKQDSFLEDVLVVELGDRRGVGACGSLLAELGAVVMLVEAAQPAAATSKWTDRPMVAAGKRSVRIDPRSSADLALLRRALAKADVVLASSDIDPAWSTELAGEARGQAIVCDITGFGASGPLAGRAYSDVLVQAMAGVIDTTGESDAAPVISRIPIAEWSAGLYALAGVLAALRARDTQGCVQSVEVALFDVAVSWLTTFLPAHFVGTEPKRVGNHHPSMSPWNAYRALDGWVMLCAGSNDMWRRVCDVIGRPELVAEERYSTPTHRVKINAEVDALVQAWSLEHNVADCIERLSAAGLPCGPIYSIAELFTEASLVHRRMVRELHDRTSGKSVRVAGAVFRGTGAHGIAAAAIPSAGEDQALLERYAARRRVPPPWASASGEPIRSVLAGIRVVEIGSYTTAPLCARQLAALGADVIKVEPPDGDPARALPPLRSGHSYFFVMTNSDKRALTLDLRAPQGKSVLRALLARADVFVDNLKPGSLSRLGFGREALSRLNPGLVHCSVSGFGADSPLADRPGMDTTIQGMAGIMDLTRAGETPFKTGVSVADLTGAQLGLAGILAALARRERTGLGCALDMSMQDAGAWLTRAAWNREVADEAAATLVRCEDGYVAAEANAGTLLDAASEHVSASSADRSLSTRLVRAELVEHLASRGVTSAPVLRVSEVVRHPQTLARALILKAAARDGLEWPLLASPIRLAATPAVVQQPIGDAAADPSELLKAWGVAI
ncbi:MAG: CoA transferase [Burkholderiales bacterium]|nr:CoA transferase [Burkholderiales bacterium]